MGPGTLWLSFLTWMSVCSSEAVPLSAPVRPRSPLCAYPSAEDAGIQSCFNSFLARDWCWSRHSGPVIHYIHLLSMAVVILIFTHISAGLISLWFSSDSTFHFRSASHTRGPLSQLWCRGPAWFCRLYASAAWSCFSHVGQSPPS